jgi:hypothetical protein
MQAKETVSKTGDDQPVYEALSRVQEDVSKLVEGFDLRSISNRLIEYGRENPVGLAFTAMTLGLAAGFLLKASRQGPARTSSSSPRL